MLDEETLTLFMVVLLVLCSVLGTAKEMESLHVAIYNLRKTLFVVIQHALEMALQLIDFYFIFCIICGVGQFGQW